MYQNSIVVFVCEHGAAKSILATAYFNQMVNEKKLNLQAIARGTDPDAELSPKTVIGLQGDGLTPSEARPKNLTSEDLANAQLIVSFCELPEEFQNGIPVEKWENIPPVSEDYSAARDAILEKLQRLPQLSER